MIYESYDLFDRPENKAFDPETIRHSRMVAAAGLTLPQILTEARERGIVGRGTARSGVFQVQCDRGVWVHASERRIDLSSSRKANNVRFASWEQIEQDEVNGGDGDVARIGSIQIFVSINQS